jgi:hypothetical protein
LVKLNVPLSKEVKMIVEIRKPEIIKKTSTPTNPPVKWFGKA